MFLCSDPSSLIIHTPGVDLTKLNKSGIPNGKIIHISDKDFEAFPQFAPIFHGTKQGVVVYANGTRIFISLDFLMKNTKIPR